MTPFEIKKESENRIFENPARSSYEAASGAEKETQSNLNSCPMKSLKKSAPTQEKSTGTDYYIWDLYLG
jgi:hypothetical protein